MDSNIYDTIIQGCTLMNITVAKAQQECDNPEKVKFYAGELRKTVQSLQQIPESQFSPEGRRSYERLLSEIDDFASELAKHSDNPTTVMQLVGENLKSSLTQLGNVLKSECPEIRGRSFWETIKERFKK